MSLSADANILAIGAFLNEGNGYASGHVRVYSIADDGESWKQLGKDINGEKSGDQSGYCLDLSSDGKNVVISSHKNSENGLESGYMRIFNIEY